MKDPTQSDEIPNIATARRRPGPGGPRKHATATTAVDPQAFTDDDEVTNLTAVKLRLAEMLGRPDLLERDMAALNKDYRKVIIELQEAKTRAEASKLGVRRFKTVNARSFDDAI